MSIVVVVRFPTASPSLSSDCSKFRPTIYYANEIITLPPSPPYSDYGKWKMHRVLCEDCSTLAVEAQCHQARSTYRQFKRTWWEVGTLFPIWSTLRSTYVLAAPPPWLSELSASNSSSFNPKHASGGSYHRPCHLGCLISVKKISMTSLLNLQRCLSDSWCRSSDVAKKRVKTAALVLLCLKSQRLKDNRVVSASNNAGITSCISLT